MLYPELDFERPDGCVAEGFYDTSRKSLGGELRMLTVVASAACARRSGPVVLHHRYTRGEVVDEQVLLPLAQIELGRAVAAQCVNCPNNSANIESVADQL